MTEQQRILLQDDERVRKGVFPTPKIWVEKSETVSTRLVKSRPSCHLECSHCLSA